MSVLSVNHLSKSYRKGFIPRKHQVLHDVSFGLKQGSVTGFLGGNGAGKTTTLKCILGLIFPDGGEFSFFNGQPLSNEVKARIGFLPERPYFYEYLSGAEFLRFYSQLTQNLTRVQLNERIDELLRKVHLLDAKDRPLRSYSKGMLQKIGMAQALIHRPELLILDEPMSGLDPDGRLAISEIIKDIAANEATVFFSSHLLKDVESLCDDLVILKSGKIVYEGGLVDLIKQYGSGPPDRVF